MTLVAIHQPNYLPWLGYFVKMARADVFIFLDNADYSKNSYTNRVQVLNSGHAHWLTVPVTVRLGQKICDVRIAQPDWVAAHLASLGNFYRRAHQFAIVWADVVALYDGVSSMTLSQANETLVRRVALRLGLSPRFMRASEIDVGDARSTERLVSLVAAVAPGGSYLSGSGGAKYQEERQFVEAGLALVYNDYRAPAYDPSIPGLSVLDAVFHLGWEGAARLVRT